MKLRILGIAALFAVAAAGPISIHTISPRESPYRLPRTLVPENYTVYLVPYLDNEGTKTFTFDGEVTIRFRVAAPTSVITLHSHALDIMDGSIKVFKEYDNVDLIPVDSYANETMYQFLHINLGADLEQDQLYYIRMSFSGKLSDEMLGFYRSSYNEDGDVKWMATTQFESVGARMAFPCFDEPEWKATFIINIARKQDVHALANMPLVETSEPADNIGGRVWDTFQETEIMPTYLVAFIVSDIHSISYNNYISVWARKNSIEQGVYALQVAPRLLKALEDFTGIKYGWPKLDNVAIADFAAGAMENWGLITYRETSLLYDPIESTESNKQRVATVIAHEFAHLWFSCLVTLEWWSYTWLNEGFARYLQAVATDVAYPEWDLMDQFVVDHFQSIMRTDSLKTSSPLTFDCETPAEIDAMFSTISYSKGASIIRMIHHTLTDETFKKAINNYLVANSHKSVTPALLFDALDEQAAIDGVLPSGVTVAEFADNWTTKQGYPVIHVKRTHENPTVIEITQDQFLLDGTITDTLWWVPLSWTRKTEVALKAFTSTVAQDWIRGVKTYTINTEAAHDEWIIFNNQQTGYYRVSYDTELSWPLIMNALKSADFEKIHVLNRAQIIDDALNLARGGVGTYDKALESTDYLKNEVEYIPWAAAFNAFSYLDSRLYTYPEFNSFKSYVLLSLEQLYKLVTFFETPQEVQTSILNRVNVLTWACKYGLEDCVKNAQAEFKDLMENGKMVSSNKKSVVYCTALREGNKADWDLMWDKYINSDLATEQVLILSALGCTDDPDLLNDYLTKSITENSGIRKQDASSVFSSVYNNPAGVDIAFDFMINNFDVFPNFFLGSGTLSNAITGVAAKLTTREQVDKLIAFVAANADTIDASAGAKAIEAAEADLVWAENNADSILKWMKEHTTGGAGITRTNTIFCLAVAVMALLYKSL